MSNHQFTTNQYEKQNASTEITILTIKKMHFIQLAETMCLITMTLTVLKNSRVCFFCCCYI